MYKEIKSRQSVYAGSLENLINYRSIAREEAEQIVKERRDSLERELDQARSEKPLAQAVRWGGVWNGCYGGPVEKADNPVTGIALTKLQFLMRNLCKLPEGFAPHPKIERLLSQRLKMGEGSQPLDWGAAELLAMASLVSEGIPLRMSGQDVRRGTFSHRHAYIYDYESGRGHSLLSNINSTPGLVSLYNSPLSEAGVLGFEYGYSLDCPEGLVVWEAQFGDFCNAAQVIIDQFIASAEDKWDRLSGIVLLLPHGFEGQGPEHSSARLERFLTLAAEDNLQIAQPSTPAQYFHMLRRHVLRRWKKPLIVMTPKSLLRLPECTSTLAELEQGAFNTVIADDGTAHAQQTRKILLCTGRIYYDLIKRRQETSARDIAIVRLEELYPFPLANLQQALQPYEPQTPVIWVQDEPLNMGAWPYLRMRFCHRLLETHPFSAVTRPASASPATGSQKSHQMEQARLLDEAFAS